MVRSFIGIGANLDDPVGQCLSAIESLNVLVKSRLVRVSSFYESDPMGPPDQPSYINAVASLDTSLEAHELLDQLQRIEEKHDRRRDGVRWSARTLDLDLLLYGTQTIATERLSVPHPGLTQRSFVLVPLLEIAPSIEIPGHGPAVSFNGVGPEFGIKKMVIQPPGANEP